jgi:hypothetical protein
MIEKYQPIPPIDPEINWEMNSKRITQSVFITLSVDEMWVELDKLKPTTSFLNDLKIARSLKYKRLKYEYFNMMVEKYGFLFWQEPSLDVGSFLELEIDLIYSKNIDLKEAVRTLKTMWKNHLWNLLKDFKVFPERRMSKDTFKDLLKTVEDDGQGYRFLRRVKGINGQSPKNLDFEQVFDQMKMPLDPIFVRCSNREWSINDGQFIFNFASKNNQNGLSDSYLTQTILNGNICMIYFINKQPLYQI